jgi:hypothetical protein
MAIGFWAANFVCDKQHCEAVRSSKLIVISRVCFQSQELIERDVLFNIIPRE